ncbi:hypothetical protein LPJ73_001939 [Coemansia sp. RSA 2703]|nr:hypothetical protein LPJ73_001939 [Coemansia sp. RSA 2703]KAJ2375455.1 hypothetical protein IW150_002542 [Coemansia sp. RSA 2607]KAJ2396122.1 hypothetical protein GGI05_001274 [Coemansia sp. RSA 2603]
MFDPVSTAPSSWTASDSFSFHLSLARYTEFKNQTLAITHSYLDNRDILIIEALEAKYTVDLASAYPNTISKPDYVTYLEYDNEGSIEKNCRRLFALLCDLQQTTGGKYTMRQLNNKHINTRSRLTAPFISLHDYGYFIRNQKPRGPRPTPEQIANMRITAIRRTNVDPKNTTAIKALYKYLTQRHLFWCELTQTVAVVRESEDSTKCMDDSSEADRWMRAMITVHGKQMVDYLDCCVDKLINSYIADLIADNKLDQLSTATTAECMTLTERVNVFHMIIRNLNAMCKGKSKSKYVPEPTTHRLSAETRPKSASPRPIKRVFSDIDEHGSSSECSPQLGIKRARTFSTASFLGTPVLPDVSIFGNQNDKQNSSIINGYPTPTLSATIAELQNTPQLSFAKSNPLQSQCVPSAATGLFMSVEKSHTDILTTSDPASKGIQSLGLFEWIDEMTSIANGTLLS